MTETEQQRRNDARERARSAPADEHVDFQFKDSDSYLCCFKCGLVRPRAGWVKACRGRVRLSLRGPA